jgi:hypothetical protein
VETVLPLPLLLMLLMLISQLRAAVLCSKLMRPFFRSTDFLR